MQLHIYVGVTMGRKPRIDIAGYCYHITARGNYRQNIFLEDKDKKLYLNLLAHYRDELGFTIYAFCLMNNHVHLLIKRTDRASLAEIVKSINGRYSKEFNKRRKKQGHLFQGRFYSVIVENEIYLLEATRYIHLNPARAGIIGKAEDYVWSSLRTYLGIDNFPFVDKSYLKYFGKRPSTMVEKYRIYLDEAVDAEKNLLSGS